MSRSLYQTYRPKSWEEVLGQEAVVQALLSSVKKGRNTHAYLFSGPRGTGKTSIARILAKELGIKGPDLSEIDAASNTGVDEIRALQEAIQTLPMESSRKMYIIDEAHMLSKSAFNALLKTLEEPPAHVVFVLATTELHKLPETVISRCEHHYFKKPKEELLAKMVISVAKKEGFNLSKNGAELIAMLGEGSFRDTHGVLQKIVGSVEGVEIESRHVRALTNAPSRELVFELLSAILSKKIPEALEAVARAENESVDFAVFIKLLLRELRRAMLIKYSKVMAKKFEVDLPSDEFKYLSGLGEGEMLSGASSVLLALLDASENLSKSDIPTLPLELAILKISLPPRLK